MPSITIHIPCYNYGHFVSEAIESVLAQTCEDWEAIIIDDASTDRTPEVLAEYRDPRIRVIRHTENVGNIATYNEAIRAARGDFFVILSADDRYRPRFAERVLEMFCTHPELGLVYTNYERIDREGAVLPGRPPMPHHRDGIYDELGTLLERSYIAGCSAVSGVGMLREMGLYDNRFPSTADTFLWRRIAVVAPFGYIEEPLYQYRAHGTNMSAGSDRARILEDEHREHLTVILSDPRTPPAVRARRGHFYGELYWSIAAWHAKKGRWGLFIVRLVQAIGFDPTVWVRHRPSLRAWRSLRHLRSEPTPFQQPTSDAGRAA